MIIIALVVSFLGFTLSASAGLGGSLIIVPAMALMLGPKEGVAMASAMLALNNVGKVIAYRKVIPLKASSLIVIMTILGSLIGASLLVNAPEDWVAMGIAVAIAATFLLERLTPDQLSRFAASPLAFVSGGTSGFSGTSGPLKGIAIRSLRLQREYFVGAASLVSLAGDTAKVLVFSEASLFNESSIRLLLLSMPLMAVGVWLGRRINQAMGERGYAALFWVVMLGYSVRLIAF